ncbi:MAG: tetratricopeptide repeat protein [Deltaproteobacteria bacterium]|nr:tetratricopeptide repeat protein [Deltaproteobacteria bacterium]
MRALILHRRLLRAQRAPWRSATSISLNNIGDLAMEAGDFQRARAAYQESLNLRERVLRNYPQSAEALRDVAYNLVMLGDTAMATRDVKRAQESYQRSLEVAQHLLRQTPTSKQALDIIRRLLQQNPQSLYLQHDLALAWMRTGAAP